MKAKKALLVGAVMTAWVLGGVSSVSAQGPPPGGGGRGGGPGGGPKKGERSGGLRDLGKAADHFGAKEDGRLTDSELKKLNEATGKVWKLIVKRLKGRND